MDEAELSPEEKAKMCTATRVTVGTISQIEGNSFKTYFVPRIRGRFVCHDIHNYKFNTREEARKSGREILNKWRPDYEKSLPPQKEGE